MRALKYALGEALLSLWRARSSALFSIVTIAATLLIFGGFLLLAANLEPLVEGWSAAAELSVYLGEEVSDTERSAIDQMLVESEAVAAREYVSRAEALARFTREFDDLSGALSGFDDNSFPASFEVRLQTSEVETTAIDDLAARLREADGVADVRYDRVWLERLTAAATLLRAVTLGFAVVLLVGAALTVSNVVRLAFYGRRDEIEIMRLVGAPAMYIRGPFLVEGILQGGLGAGLAIATLWMAFLVARDRYGELVVEVLGLGDLQFLSARLGVLLLVGGMGVGCLGGLIATWGDPSRGTRAPRRETAAGQRVDT